MNNAWTSFCETYDKNRYEKEDKVQKVFEQIFYVLFQYNPLVGDIESHRVLHIGSTDRVIPDIIIRDSSRNKDLFIVELKQLNLQFDEKYKEQLLSYMRLLSLNIGILICDSVYVYVLDNNEPLCYKIEVSSENLKGEEFINIFRKDNFSAESVKKFVLFNENVKKIRDMLEKLDVKDLIKLYFISDFEENEIDEALKLFNVILTKVTPLPNPPRPNPPRPNPPRPNPLGLETTQNWIKRILEYLFNKNLLPEQEILLLHDLDYSKKTFGINYALFVDNYKDTEVSGHGRYWKTCIGKYYVCSQWWLGKNDEYERNIRRWLEKSFRSIFLMD